LAETQPLCHISTSFQLATPSKLIKKYFKCLLFRNRTFSFRLKKHLSDFCRLPKPTNWYLLNEFLSGHKIFLWVFFTFLLSQLSRRLLLNCIIIHVLAATVGCYSQNKNIWNLDKVISNDSTRSASVHILLRLSLAILHLYWKEQGGNRARKWHSVKFQWTNKIDHWTPHFMYLNYCSLCVVCKCNIIFVGFKHNWGLL